MLLESCSLVIWRTCIQERNFLDFKTIRKLVWCRERGIRFPESPRHRAPGCPGLLVNTVLRHRDGWTESSAAGWVFLPRLPWALWPEQGFLSQPGEHLFPIHRRKARGAMEWRMCGEEMRGTWGNSHSHSLQRRLFLLLGFLLLLCACVHLGVLLKPCHWPTAQWVHCHCCVGAASLL